MEKVEIPSEREPNYQVNPVFPARWSSRAFNGKPLAKEKLMQLFEAARWTPSSFNAQPWRFVYALHGTEAFDEMRDTLVPFNKEWAQHAGALIMVISRENYIYNEKPNEAHHFDTGAAWQSIALQAILLGLNTHAMGGFDTEKARSVAKVPAGYTLHCIIAVGEKGNTADLSEELQKLDKPSKREPVEFFTSENTFKETSNSKEE